MSNRKSIFAFTLLAIIVLAIDLKPGIIEAIIDSLPGPTGSSLACNSPELIKEFQRKLDERIASLRPTINEKPINFLASTCLDKRGNLEEKNRCVENARQNYRKNLERLALDVERTETLGQVGNSLSCSMDYTFAEGSDPETFKFLLGRDDDGHLVWHFDSRIIAPYNRPY